MIEHMFGPADREAETEVLVGVLRELAAVDVDVCDAPGLAAATTMWRRLQGFLDVRATSMARRAAGLHAEGDSGSPEELLATAGRMGTREAGRVVRRAETLDDAPAMGDALAAGEITAAHTDALVNAVAKLDESTRAELVARDRELARAASRMSPERFASHCRRVARQVAGDDGLSVMERQRRETSLRRWIDESTGMYRLEGRFDPETGHRIFTALDAEVDALRADSNDSGVVADLATDNAHLAAHGLARLVSATHRERRPGSSELCVHIDDQTLRRGLHEHSVCELADGTEIPVGLARRLACEAQVIPIVYGSDSAVLDVGRGQRVANRAQRRAARKMYRTCAVGGCTVRFAHCELHHIVPWVDGGLTDLANLVPLCLRHHHLVHEGGWTIRLDHERTLHLSRPDGTLHGRFPLEHNPSTRGRRARPPTGADPARRRSLQSTLGHASAPGP